MTYRLNGAGEREGPSGRLILGLELDLEQLDGAVHKGHHSSSHRTSATNLDYEVEINTTNEDSALEILSCPEQKQSNEKHMFPWRRLASGK